MKEIDDMFAAQAQQDADGTLTLGEAFIGRYYRLLAGRHAGRVVIKSRDRIDGQDIVRFANGLTWAYLDSLRDTLCESTRPTFSPPKHDIDYAQATWYGDDGSGPHHHEW